MKPGQVDVRIGRMVLDRPHSTATFSLSHAIRTALEAELHGSGQRATGVPQAIARQIAQRIGLSGGHGGLR